MKKMSRMKRKRKRKRRQRPRLKLRNKKKIKRRKKRPSSVCWKSWCFGARGQKGARAAIRG